MRVKRQRRDKRIAARVNIRLFLPLERLMRTLPLKDNQGRRRQLGDQTSPSSDPPLRAQGSRSSSSTAEWGVLGD